MPPRIWLAVRTFPPHTPEGVVPVGTHWETTTKPNIGLWRKQQAHCGSPWSHTSLQTAPWTGISAEGREHAWEQLCVLHQRPEGRLVHPRPHSRHSCRARQEERLSTFHPGLNTRRLGAKHDFPKGPAWWCAKDSAGHGDLEDLGGMSSVSRPHKLCSGTGFPMEYKQVLNPYVFNNKHVRGGSFHTLLFEAKHSHDWHSGILIKRGTSSHSKAFMCLFRLCTLKNPKNIHTVKFYCIWQRRKGKKPLSSPRPILHYFLNWNRFSPENLQIQGKCLISSKW